MQKLYLVVSQTGSIVCRIIKLFTKAPYNHCAISFEKSLDPMYSFGRKYTYSPFCGGFVKESIHYGAMKRFHKCQIVVYQLEVDDQKYNQIRAEIEQMYIDRKQYKYNYKGLFLVPYGKVIKRKKYFYCSEFVSFILRKYQILPRKLRDKDIIKPMDFVDRPAGKRIYKGRFCDYDYK